VDIAKSHDIGGDGRLVGLLYSCERKRARHEKARRWIRWGRGPVRMQWTAVVFWRTELIPGRRNENLPQESGMICRLLRDRLTDFVEAEFFVLGPVQRGQKASQLLPAEVCPSAARPIPDHRVRTVWRTLGQKHCASSRGSEGGQRGQWPAAMILPGILTAH
jgi:hypothetical protein